MQHIKAKPWWGYSMDYGWVYLDRNLPSNQPPSTELMFVRCDCNEVIDVQREDWSEPKFFFEGRVMEIASRQKEFERRLEGFKQREREFKSTVQFCFDERQAQKSQLKLHALRPVKVTAQSNFQQNSPEQVRAFLKGYYDYSDSEWTEIIRYCAWMKEKGCADQVQLNNYITSNRKWDEFKAIRALNDHGYGSKIEGITRKAYRAVCQILGMRRGDGSPLLHSERY